MQTVTHADQLFQGIKEFRNTPRPSSGSGAWTRDAVDATIVRATEAYLKNETVFMFTYSMGDIGIRTYNVIEMIRCELEELFGAHKVWVHRDESNHLGILIRVFFH